MRLFNLRNKILLFFLVLMVALVASSFYVVHRQVEGNLRALLESQLLESRKVFLQFQAFTLSLIRGKASVVANQSYMKAALGIPDMRPKDIDSAVKPLMEHLGSSAFLIFNRKGEPLHPPSAVSRSESWASPARVLKDALAGKAGLQAIRLAGSIHLAAGAPVRYAEEPGQPELPVGAVLVTEDLGRLAGELQRIAGEDSHVAVAAGKTLITTTLGQRAREEFARELARRSPSFSAVEEGRTPQAVLTLDLAGERYVALVIPIYKGDKERASVGTLTLVRSLDRVLSAQMEKIKLGLLATALVAFLVTMAVNFLFARSITRPLGRLGEGVERLSHGDLSVQVPVTSRDEVGLLTASFNQMVIGLQHKEKLKRMVSASAAREVELSTDFRLRLGGSKEDVTVLFTDIRNFTPLTERLGADGIVELLNRYFVVAGGVIAEHGGDIDKFIGDAIMVVFRDGREGVPGALAAVRCAVDLQLAVRRFNDAGRPLRQPEIAIGVGIATGEVVAGTVGTPDRMEYTVLGETVNLAARLEGESKIGKHLSIMLHPDTYAQVAGQVEADAIAGTKLKGVSGTLTIYEVKGLKTGSRE